jgi:hypothetical protein
MNCQLNEEAPTYTPYNEAMALEDLQLLNQPLELGGWPPAPAVLAKTPAIGKSSQKISQTGWN